MLWDIIDEAREALVESETASQALRSQLATSDCHVVGELTLLIVCL